MKENKGIIVHGGNINAGQISVGDNAKTEKLVYIQDASQPNPHQFKLDTSQYQKLFQVLATRFDKQELKNLCFNLGVDFDNLSGESKGDKARELLAYLIRHNEIDELLVVGTRLRQDINWTELIQQ